MVKNRKSILIEMDRLGIIPGPEETWEDWEQRIQRYEISDVPSVYPLVMENLEWQWGIAPRWMKVSEQWDNFWFWHAAACQVDDHGHVEITINPGAYLFCSMEEVLAHEMSHGARCAYASDLFDEYLAYQLSNSSLKRWLGPFFSQNVFIPLAWVVSWFLPIVLVPFFPLMNFSILYLTMACSWGFAFFRYHKIQKRYAAAFERLCKEYPEMIARWIIFRLSSEEAVLLSNKNICLEKLILQKDLPRSALFQWKLSTLKRA